MERRPPETVATNPRSLSTHYRWTDLGTPTTRNGGNQTKIAQHPPPLDRPWNANHPKPGATCHDQPARTPRADLGMPTTRYRRRRNQGRTTPAPNPEARAPSSASAQPVSTLPRSATPTAPRRPWNADHRKRWQPNQDRAAPTTAGPTLERTPPQTVATKPRSHSTHHRQTDLGTHTTPNGGNQTKIAQHPPPPDRPWNAHHPKRWQPNQDRTAPTTAGPTLERHLPQSRTSRPRPVSAHRQASIMGSVRVVFGPRSGGAVPARAGCWRAQHHSGRWT